MDNSSNVLLSKNNFASIKIIYFAILAGMISFALISYLVIAKTVEFNAEGLLNILTFLVPVFAITMIFVSRFIFARRTQQIDNSISVEQKLIKYRTSKIISWVLIESAGLFCIVTFILTKFSLFLIVFIVVIAAFVLSKPSIDEFISLFNVDPDEKKN